MIPTKSLVEFDKPKLWKSLLTFWKRNNQTTSIDIETVICDSDNNSDIFNFFFIYLNLITEKKKVVKYFNI